MICKANHREGTEPLPYKDCLKQLAKLGFVFVHIFVENCLNLGHQVFKSNNYDIGRKAAEAVSRFLSE